MLFHFLLKYVYFFLTHLKIQMRYVILLLFPAKRKQHKGKNTTMYYICNVINIILYILLIVIPIYRYYHRVRIASL